MTSHLIIPDRLRKLEKPFAWIPCRILTSGQITKLSDHGKLLYFFLSLAADRRGLSFYSDQRISQDFQINALSLENARNELIHHDLIAFDDRIYQVLSLPTHQPRWTDNSARLAVQPTSIADLMRTIALPLP